MSAHQTPRLRIVPRWEKFEGADEVAAWEVWCDFDWVDTFDNEGDAIACRADIAAARSAAGLSECDVAGLTANVDQHIPVPASGAQEKAPVVVDLGQHGPEHDFEAARSALPHVCTPDGNGDRSSISGRNR